MLINATTVRNAFTGFTTVYNDAFRTTESHFEKVAMTVPSSASEEQYGWLGQFPQLRQWIGDRHVKALAAQGFTIKNLDFESTISVPENDMADDRMGIFKPMFQEMGRAAKIHPDTLVFGLLRDGFATKCFDGQFYFDTDHPLYGAAGDIAGSVSNMQAGAGPAWYLMDLSRAIKPLIWQERQKYRFRSLDRETDENVFMRKDYIYGVDARVNVGFGLWQLAFGSKADLTPENFVLAKNTMTGLRGDQGARLGIRPTHLVVPPELEEAALELLKPILGGGSSNIWANAVEVIVSHHVG
jgi:phage major head subunit gpT-like protein